MIITENNRHKLTEKYAYFKANSIRYGIKDISERGIDQMLARGVVNTWIKGY